MRSKKVILTFGTICIFLCPLLATGGVWAQCIPQPGRHSGSAIPLGEGPYLGSNVPEALVPGPLQPWVEAYGNAALCFIRGPLGTGLQWDWSGTAQGCSCYDHFGFEVYKTWTQVDSWWQRYDYCFAYWYDDPGDPDYDCDGIPDSEDTHPGEPEDQEGGLGNPGCGKSVGNPANAITTVALVDFRTGTVGD